MMDYLICLLSSPLDFQTISSAAAEKSHESFTDIYLVMITSSMTVHFTL